MKVLQSICFSAAWLSANAIAKPPTSPYNALRAGPNLVTSKDLQNDISKEGLMDNLKSLEEIADRNGGNRAFGYPGYTDSVKFITDRLKKQSNTSTFYIQEFPALLNVVSSIAFNVSGVGYNVSDLTHSPSTSAEGLNLPLVLGPAGDAGCTVQGYAGFNVANKIVLVERGSCPTGGTLAGRMRPAAAAGAAAVIIYNNDNGPVNGGTLSEPDPVHLVPGGFVNRAVGLPLVARLTAGEEIIAHFQHTQTVETKITQNIIAETNGGDPNNVVMIGAHLDSVPAGPGINDNGSGSSLILELFDALNKYQTNLKVRFAWWGAEESGLLGSIHYTSNLGAKNTTDLLTYLNFDMVSRGYFGVYDGDGSAHGLAAPPGSGVIQKMFADDLKSKGLPITMVPFGGDSDYAPFMADLKKPIGGLFTGAEQEQDACYHKPCDNYDNANATVLHINTKSAAHVLANLAMDGVKLLPKAPVARSEPLGSFQWDTQGIEWNVAGDIDAPAGHSSGCGHII